MKNTLKFYRLAMMLVLSASFAFTSCSNDDDSDEPIVRCESPTVEAYVTETSATEATVYTATVIDATPAEVWSVLTDFDNMPNWSSNTLQGIDGELVNGAAIVAHFIVDTNGTILPVPHTLIYEEGKSFGWADPIIGFDGLTDNHMYVVEACGNKTLFKQTDTFTGTNANLTPAALANSIMPLYELFNAELKAEVEK